MITFLSSTLAHAKSPEGRRPVILFRPKRPGQAFLPDHTSVGWATAHHDSLHLSHTIGAPLPTITCAMVGKIALAFRLPRDRDAILPTLHDQPNFGRVGNGDSRISPLIGIIGAPLPTIAMRRGGQNRGLDFSVSSPSRGDFAHPTRSAEAPKTGDLAGEMC